MDMRQNSLTQSNPTHSSSDPNQPKKDCVIVIQPTVAQNINLRKCYINFQPTSSTDDSKHFNNHIVFFSVCPQQVTLCVSQLLVTQSKTRTDLLTYSHCCELHFGIFGQRTLPDPTRSNPTHGWIHLWRNVATQNCWMLLFHSFDHRLMPCGVSDDMSNFGKNQFQAK